MRSSSARRGSSCWRCVLGSFSGAMGSVLAPAFSDSSAPGCSAVTVGVSRGSWPTVEMNDLLRSCSRSSFVQTLFSFCTLLVCDCIRESALRSASGGAVRSKVIHRGGARQVTATSLLLPVYADRGPGVGDQREESVARE